jgi:hypothetical protein
MQWEMIGFQPLPSISESDGQYAQETDEILDEDDLDRRKAAAENIYERAGDGKKKACEEGDRNAEFEFGWSGFCRFHRLIIGTLLDWGIYIQSRQLNASLDASHQQLQPKNIFELVANISLPFEKKRQKKTHRASPDSKLGWYCGFDHRSRS